MPIEPHGYGVADQSYQAAGGLAGLHRLVDCFYRHMDQLAEAQSIRQLHPPDLSASRQKLTYFLSGWLGGPRLYAQHFGGISIPGVHRHLPIGAQQRVAWLLCMQRAIDEQPYAAEFKTYLLAQLRVPAERIRQVCSATSLS